jgi:hypothetical protein
MRGLVGLGPAAIVIAAAWGLVACGGQPGQPHVATLNRVETSPSSAGTSSQSFKAYVDCMRARGFQLTDSGETTGINQYSSEFRAAEDACAPLFKSPPANGQQLDPRVADQLLRFAQCMRAHGIPMSDPQQSGSAVSVTVTDPQYGPSSQKYAAAHEACVKYLQSSGAGDQTPAA